MPDAVSKRFLRSLLVSHEFTAEHADSAPLPRQARQPDARSLYFIPDVQPDEDRGERLDDPRAVGRADVVWLHADFGNEAHHGPSCLGVVAADQDVAVDG